MFSISTVASSTRMPTASAKPPSVMMLMVSPSALITQMETRIDRGIETAMMIVLRQLPRNSRIIVGGQAGGDDRFANHSADGRADEDRLIGDRLDFQLFRKSRGDGGQSFAHLLDDLERRSLPHLHDGHQTAALRRREARCWFAAR